jgi:transmembrane sensor
MKESNQMENINPEMLEIILSHLQKAASQPEGEKLAAWLKEKPENLARFQEIERIWKLSDPGVETFVPDTEKAWTTVRSRIEIPAEGSNPKKGKVVAMPFSLWKVAASVLLLIGFGILLKTLFKADETWTTVSTKAEKQLFYLPDSSQVWLNRHSTLSYTRFEGKTREVKLSGEAFFQVKRRPDQAFRIQGNQSLTEVLGTSFNLKSVSGKPDEVEVVTGLVAFSSLKNPTSRQELKPGQKAEIEADLRVLKVENRDPNFMAWQTGRLEFNNLEMEKVVATLEGYYGIRIDIQDAAIRNCRFTGSFEAAELKEVLDVLSVSANIKIDKKDNVYHLRGGGCP